MSYSHFIDFAAPGEKRRNFIF